MPEVIGRSASGVNRVGVGAKLVGYNVPSERESHAAGVNSALLSTRMLGKHMDACRTLQSLLRWMLSR